MDPIFKKLNYKGQDKILVLNAPASLEPNLNALPDEAEVVRCAEHGSTIGFALVFAVIKAELEVLVKQVMPLLEKDAVFWVCYPKGTSKKYRSDFNRDTGWDVLGKYNMEPVRQVAIDEDWSALRFRNVENIKTFTRSKMMALSGEGKKRTKNK